MMSKQDKLSDSIQVLVNSNDQIKRGNPEELSGSKQRRNGGDIKGNDAHSSRSKHEKKKRNTHQTTIKHEKETNLDQDEENKIKINLKMLKKLQCLYLEDLILEILNHSKSFSDFSKTSKVRNDEMLILINLLATVCKSSLRDLKVTVLSIFLNETFTFNLYNVMENLVKPSSFSDSWEEALQFWSDVIEICENVFIVKSESNSKILNVILNAMKVNIPEFEHAHKLEISDQIKATVEEMLIQLQKKKMDYKEPPDDFHQISIYPCGSEVLKKESFLRPNVINAPYKDVKHYLDVQFRLLREDFLRPLRKGVRTCQNTLRRSVDNVNIFRNVCFLRLEPVNEHFCVRLRLYSDKSPNNVLKVSSSKRLNHGSLLCFTRDDFATVVFGRICERNSEDLKKGELIIEIDQNIPIVFNTTYTMIECEIYFEPYFQVLSTLQNISVNQFPMEKYIIHLQMDAQPPTYLKENTDSMYTVEGRTVWPLEQWPSYVTNSLNLNESQLLAFKAALTEEFALIQGPPGTGKTHLGLMIVKTLLENRRWWHQRSPILVTCYTNHALDQFMEGVLQFTDQIIRVGGRSTSEELNAFTLKGLSRIRNCSVFAKLRELNEVSAKIKTISNFLREIDSYQSIIKLDGVDEVSPQTWFYHASGHSLVEWLMLGREEVSKKTNAETIQNLGDNTFDDIFDEQDTARVSVINLKSLRDEISALETNKQSNASKKIIEDKISSLKNKYDYLSMRLAQGRQHTNKAKEMPETTDLLNPRKMKSDDRWKLYFYFIKVYKMQLTQTQNSLYLNFQALYREYNEMRILETTKALKQALVIGMTTTTAARLKLALQSLKCPIVIVEEAAEILEAHIVASLTEHCQHLILIGDHQQLRPKTADFNIENKFKMSISLLERMMINSNPDQFHVLNVQHRMRPEISSLISTIYPFLEDHPSVAARPAIRGVRSSLFFLNHDYVETECDGATKKNLHEISFFIHFAKYLIMNGYSSNNITILTAYMGQMFGFQQETSKHKELKNVRVSVLDNYQGEESDIILLSLVRNNNENKIGFLSTENRICVALSRARNGLFIMGNLTQLCRDSDLWVKVAAILEEQDALGSKLPLVCHVHPEVVTYVKSDVDFTAIPNGGCTKICGTMLDCGHECDLICHVDNREHKDYKCEEKCIRTLCEQNENHKCKKKCYQKCGPCNFLVQKNSPCGHEVEIECHLNNDSYKCSVVVNVNLSCGHTVEKPCHEDLNTTKCSHICNYSLACGHTCGLFCHQGVDPDHLQYKCKKRCGKHPRQCSTNEESHRCRKFCYEQCELCTILVRKNRKTCSHSLEVPCYSNVDDLECTESCAKVLKCGHQCKNRCYEKCGSCDVKVSKVYPVCGHSVKTKCLDEPDRKFCNKKCPLKLPCGHNCVSKCNEPCTTTCTVLVNCSMLAECGHTVTQIKCNLSKNSSILQKDGKLPSKYCNTPCDAILNCGHRCSGSCSDCFQGRFHKKCEIIRETSLICGHQRENLCGQEYNPCTAKCFYKCQHNSCSKGCNEICTPCRKKCTRSCIHQKCSQICGALCDVDPCKEPCEQKLKCGHNCVGFCGDPCPPKCLQCHQEYFGPTANGRSGRYVLLNDCKHIIEDDKIEECFQNNERKLVLIVCPKCEGPIISTQRYSNYVKVFMRHLALIKTKVNGTSQDNDDKRHDLQRQFFVLKEKSQTLYSELPKIKATLEALESHLTRSVKNKQRLSKYQLETFNSKLKIIEYIITVCPEIIKATTKYFPSQVNFILNILKTNEQDYFTRQEIDDISCEVNRLQRTVELTQVKRLLEIYKMPCTEKFEGISREIENYITDFTRFSEDHNNSSLKLLEQLMVPTNTLKPTGLKVFVNWGFKRDDWFVCANSHVHTTTECSECVNKEITSDMKYSV